MPGGAIGCPSHGSTATRRRRHCEDFAKHSVWVIWVRVQAIKRTLRMSLIVGLRQSTKLVHFMVVNVVIRLSWYSWASISCHRCRLRRPGYLPPWVSEETWSSMQNLASRAVAWLDWYSRVASVAWMSDWAGPRRNNERRANHGSPRWSMGSGRGCWEKTQERKEKLWNRQPVKVPESSRKFQRYDVRNQSPR